MVLRRLHNLAAGEGLLAEEEASPGRLAFLLFIQLEAEAADDALLSQATKNLVFLAPRLLAGDAAAGRVPAQPAPAKTGFPAEATKLGNGSAPAKSGDAAGKLAGTDVDDDVIADVDGDMDADEEEAEGDGRSALTLHGLVRRMARLADDRAWPRQAARLAALRFSAALGSRLGPEDIVPYLPSMLLPLYRITESNAANPNEVSLLGCAPTPCLTCTIIPLDSSVTVSVVLVLSWSRQLCLLGPFSWFPSLRQSLPSCGIVFGVPPKGYSASAEHAVTPMLIAVFCDR